MTDPPRNPAVLHVVDTPIGNLEDLSDRARRILTDVPLVIAEDTRRTRKLLSHLDAGADLSSFHEHSDPEKIENLTSSVRHHGRAALVSDAGSPVISDPGAGFVRAALDRGIRVSPVPGPTAVSAALSGAGIRADRFLFAGYPPDDAEQFGDWLDLLDTDAGPAVLFTPPHDLTAVLTRLADRFPDRRMTLGRELTKRHEEFIRGTGADLLDRLDAEEIRGEYTLVLAPADPDDRDSQRTTVRPVDEKHLDVLLDEDLKPSTAARILSSLRDVDRGDAYDLLQERKEHRESSGG